MNKVLDHASIFYHKRFILEKEERIAVIMEKEPTIIDAEADEIIDVTPVPHNGCRPRKVRRA